MERAARAPPPGGLTERPFDRAHLAPGVSAGPGRPALADCRPPAPAGSRILLRTLLSPDPASGYTPLCRRTSGAVRASRTIVPLRADSLSLMQKSA
ncbi:hypothetical protein PCAR4_940058 [Paraburkholderia caribensis]|nr:hypothetical protein PCAR4_940058 [Paraburkholderia caribensis]